MRVSDFFVGVSMRMFRHLTTPFEDIKTETILSLSYLPIVIGGHISQKELVGFMDE